jgi:steroid delta-isomerase-like uncharacterized protein
VPEATGQYDVLPRFIEGMHGSDRRAIAQLLGPQFAFHFAGMEPIRGWEGLKQMMHSFQTAFPDARVTLDHHFGNADHVTARFSIRGTHKGDFMGLSPTGKQMTFAGISVARIENGKLAESWVYTDVLQQLQAARRSS